MQSDSFIFCLITSRFIAYLVISGYSDLELNEEMVVSILTNSSRDLAGDSEKFIYTLVSNNF